MNEREMEKQRKRERTKKRKKRQMNGISSLILDDMPHENRTEQIGIITDQ